MHLRERERKKPRSLFFTFESESVKKSPPVVKKVVTHIMSGIAIGPILMTAYLTV